MGKFKDVITKIEESFEDDVVTLKQVGYEFIDKAVVDDFEIGLFKQKLGDFYETSLNLKGYSFWFDQHRNDVPISKGNIMKNLREIVKIAEGWVSKYSDAPHYIGSMNDSKLKLYHKLIQRFSNLRVSDIEGIYFRIYL